MAYLPYAFTLKVIQENGVEFPCVLLERENIFELIVVGFEYYNREAFLLGHYAYGQVLATCSKADKKPAVEEILQQFPLMKSKFEPINEDEDEVFFNLVMETPS